MMEVTLLCTYMRLCQPARFSSISDYIYSFVALKAVSFPRAHLIVHAMSARYASLGPMKMSVEILFESIKIQKE